MEFKEVVETMEQDLGRKIDPLERTLMLFAYYEGGRHYIDVMDANLTKERDEI